MRTWLLMAIAVLLAIPVATPQATSELYAFAVTTDEAAAVIPAGGEHKFTLTIADGSRDSTTTLTGQPGGVGVEPHATSWKLIFRDGDDRSGWNILLPPPARTFGGETAERTLIVQVDALLVRDPMLSFTLNATHRTSAGRFYSDVEFTVVTLGNDAFNAQSIGSVQLSPNEIRRAGIRVTNSALLPREFLMEIRENSCGLQMGYAPAFLVDARTATEIPLTILGPDDKFWYNYELCSLKIAVFPADDTNNVRVVGLDPQIIGIQVDPAWVFTAFGLALLVFVLVILFLRRKARIEEELLGKPQKPWHIPVEQVYLEALKERDPQAHYVVRHFLMEEEYASALAWYHEFKKATKGKRAKERLVVSQEHKYERFRKKWEKRVAAPMKGVARLEASLQKKLDKRGKAGLREDRKKWGKLTKNMREAYAKKVAKADLKWQKAVKKAQKKKQPEPPKPVLAEPDYPPEPSMDRVVLKDHPWQKKVDKARRKALKKQGNLEVRFEKKDAKMLRKVRRRVQKIARKLDDPEFIEEHPLLSSPSDS